MFAISHTLVHSARCHDKSSRILFRTLPVLRRSARLRLFSSTLLPSSLRNFRSLLLKRIGKMYAFSASVACIARNVIILRNVERRRGCSRTFPSCCTRDRKTRKKQTRYVFVNLIESFRVKVFVKQRLLFRQMISRRIRWT